MNLAAQLSFAFAARSIRALVVQGAGPHFCTGGRYDKKASIHSPWWVKACGLYGSGYIFDLIRSVPILSVSVLHGSSIGGGLLLGLASDHRVSTVGALFRLGVAPYGLSPVVMATRILPMLLGFRFSTKMYVEDMFVDARRAVASKIIYHSLPDPQTAREHALSHAVVGRHPGSPSATIERHARHFSQETLFNTETGETINSDLSSNSSPPSLIKHMA